MFTVHIIDSMNLLATQERIELELKVASVLCLYGQNAEIQQKGVSQSQLKYFLAREGIPRCRHFMKKFEKYSCTLNVVIYSEFWVF